MITEPNFLKGQITVRCPSCGDLDYEFDLEADDLNAHISVPCYECDNRIEIVVDVMVQTVHRNDDV